MSKSILLPIHPEWCEKIFRGEKTIEVRKTKPKLQTPFKCYVYCKKSKTPFLLPTYSKGDLTDSDVWQNGNEKVIGEFVVKKITEYEYLNQSFNYWSYDLIDSDLLNACMTLREFNEYGQGKTLYGWHITNAKLYDKPRKLSSFYKSCNYNVYGNCYLRNMLSCGYQDIDEYSGLRVCGNTLTRSPQSFCYVEEAEDAD